MTPEQTALHQLARLAGAMPIGEDGHFLFSPAQLAALVELVGGGRLELIRLHDRLEEKGVPVQLTC